MKTKSLYFAEASASSPIEKQLAAFVGGDSRANSPRTLDREPAPKRNDPRRFACVGALYFSQQAVNKLLPASGISLPTETALPERLRAVQELIARGDERAARIYETIGVYLGYTIPWYAEFYKYRHLLVLGRVLTGHGGDILIAKAREVLAAEFPDLAEKIAVHVPDEKSRRVGQAVAAASLPVIPK